VTRERIRKLIAFQPDIVPTTLGAFRAITAHLASQSPCSFRCSLATSQYIHPFAARITIPPANNAPPRMIALRPASLTRTARATPRLIYSMRTTAPGCHSPRLILCPLMFHIRPFIITRVDLFFPLHYTPCDACTDYEQQIHQPNQPMTAAEPAKTQSKAAKPKFCPNPNGYALTLMHPRDAKQYLTPLREARALQRLMFCEALAEGQKPSIAALLARSWCLLQDSIRIMKGIPTPGQLRPDLDPMQLMKAVKRSRSRKPIELASGGAFSGPTEDVSEQPAEKPAKPSLGKSCPSATSASPELGTTNKLDTQSEIPHKKTEPQGEAQRNEEDPPQDPPKHS
jgi:hypothetical protein